LRALYEAHVDDAAAAGLGSTLEEFRAALAHIRKTGYAITKGEIDQGRAGIAAPILNEEKRAIGSLSYVVSDQIEMRACQRLATIAQSGAQEIEASLSKEVSLLPGQRRSA
jgi:DNA-binding IclR family transcriptional regulator